MTRSPSANIDAFYQANFGVEDSNTARSAWIIMPHYLHLIKWTDQGIRAIKESPKRAESARNAAEQMGGKIQLWYTMGKYDIVGLSEFPDDGAAQKFLFWLGSLGNVRTTTLKAWTEEEAAGLIRQLQ